MKPTPLSSYPFTEFNCINSPAQPPHSRWPYRYRSKPRFYKFGTGAETFPSAIGMSETTSGRKSKVQRVCCAAPCGIHLGPFKYLSSSTLVQPYIQVSGVLSLIIESRILHLLPFHCHLSSTNTSRSLYRRRCLQVCIFIPLSIPMTLINHSMGSSDFLSNLLIRILNSGIPDSGLIAHLSSKVLEWYWPFVCI